MQTTTAPVLYSGRCINEHFVKVTLEDTYIPRSNPRLAAFCACGSSTYVKRMDVEVTEKPCNGRCTNAVSSRCHCACGGENHGAERLSFA